MKFYASLIDIICNIKRTFKKKQKKYNNTKDKFKNSTNKINLKIK